MPTKTQDRSAKKHAHQSGNPIVWAEVPVKDLERAQKFYARVFGFKFQPHEADNYKMAMFNGAPDKYGSGGALIEGESYVPSYDGTMVYFSTPDIPYTLRKAEEAGGRI